MNRETSWSCGTQVEWVRGIVQDAVIKIIPKKKKCKKAKWLSEEVLQIAEQRRDEKGKEGKERYTHLNAEFHKIASTRKRNVKKQNGCLRRS